MSPHRVDHEGPNLTGDPEYDALLNAELRERAARFMEEIGVAQMQGEVSVQSDGGSEFKLRPNDYGEYILAAI